MKKIIPLLIIASIAILAGFLSDVNEPKSDLKKITINDAEIFVEIADTPQKRAQGLSERASLPQNDGVLFIFEAPGRYPFWMKEMNFALDFLWINGDRIVEVSENVQPQDYQPPKNLTPSQAVDKVLELNAGAVKRLNIKVWDKIKF